MSFVHLHTHSQYSLLEASCRSEDLIRKANEWGMPALALTDIGNMFGAAEFYFSCKSAGIKPIIGLEVLIAPGSRHEKTQDRDAISTPNRKLVLLAMDYKGYQRLTKISTIGYQEGFYYRPRIDYEILQEHNQGLIALSGGLQGEIPWTFLNRGPDEAKRKANVFKEIYGDRFYLEMNRTGVPAWETVNPFLMELSRELGIPLVAANDVHYTEQEDQLGQEVLVCIGSNKTIMDENRYKLGTDQFYFKSPKEMRDLFSDMPEVYERTLEISDRCNVEFKLKDKEGQAIYHLPVFPTERGLSLTGAIRLKSEDGLKVRLDFLRGRGWKFSKELLKEYNDRLEYELSVIDSMGFNGYFLIVEDFISWAKGCGIPVGPGRGSGAGSLVAYCLGITDLEPLSNELIFERFLNPERISMPDFDIDFCQDRRGEVIDYVTNKYGQENVSQIITYGRLKAKAAVRDVGRVLGMLYSDVDPIAKLIPDDLDINLTKALEQEPKLSELMEMDPQVNNLINIALKIEGLVRHAGIHAAGVIIADQELVNYSPLARGSDGESIIQYDMKYAEKMGLIKFDFLGLKTLTHIQHSLDLIKKNRNKTILSEEIDINDKAIYETLSRGDTTGVFQFSGDGITDATRMIKPTSFADIMAITSLYRPGPMDMIRSFTARHHGTEEVEYLFVELEEILKETHGIIVYQEQVQLIAAKIAGYSLGEADMLRRAMGKKITSEMEQQRARFIEGAVSKKFDKEKAEELFELMFKFASYGFNKSHAAGYSVITAQTAWLKNHYTAEFYGGLLSSEMNNTDKVVRIVKDARQHDIEVGSPHVNKSSILFDVRDNMVFYSMGAIKGVGSAAVEALIEGRNSLESQQFTSLEEFFDTIDLRRVNKKVVECLIKAGGLDGFDYNRASLLNGYTKFLERAELNRHDAEVGQVSLFSISEEAAEQKVVLDSLPPWTRQTRLQYEKEVLGFYLSDHPLNGLDRFLRLWTSCSIEDMDEEKYESLPKIKGKTHFGKVVSQCPVTFAGIIGGQKLFITKKGTKMAFAYLEGLSSTIELVIPPDAYEDLEAKVNTDDPVLVSGKLEQKEGHFKVIVDDIEIIEEKMTSSRGITFNLSEKFVESQLEELKNICEEFPGETKVSVSVFLNDLKRVTYLDISEDFRVKTNLALVERLHKSFGDLEFVGLK